MVPQTLWLADAVDTTRRAKGHIKGLFPGEVPFDTPKPERLLQRIIHIASDPGDIVLDPFLGSGTTAAVAHKMGRRFVGIERSRETVETFVLPRLSKVVAGEDPGGITEASGWQGGGGCRVLDVGPTMFAEDEGLVVLADWAAGTELARATAAQMGFRYVPDGPLCGRKGRQRLAVIDGLVSPEVVRLLLEVVAPEERLVVAGTSLDPQAEQELRKTRPGSRALKIPGSILVSYADAFRWRPLAPSAPLTETERLTDDGADPNTEEAPAPLTQPAPSPEVSA
jgi:adenine-specific DNA-methyltransferase